jgi:hypothetical protein
MDTRTLKSLRAPMDHPTFKRVYFRLQDRWARMHPSGAMPQGVLLAIVDEVEETIAKEEAAAKPKPTVLDAVAVTTNGKAKKEKAVA